MKLTEQLKRWLVENEGVNEDAEDAEFRKAAGNALIEDKLPTEKFAELTADPDAGVANEFAKSLVDMKSAIDALAESIKPKKDDQAADKAAKEKAEKEKAAKEKAEVEAAAKEKTAEIGPSTYEKMLAGFAEDGGGGSSPRIKGANERYSTTKTALTFPERIKGNRPHPLAGGQVREFGRALDTGSDLDYALAGVWAKWQLQRKITKLPSNRLAFESLPEHDKGLFHYLLDKTEFDFSTDRKRVERPLTGREKQALIDDDESGGVEAAPVVFDDRVIQAPLLNGELYPRVNTTTLDRGRQIEGVSTGTVTGGWGGVDDSEIDLFDTASYVQAFNTTIFRWEGSVHIGLDFLSDTPIDFGRHITAQYGERLLTDLDNVIATGNGTTQPEGIMNHAGVTDVAWLGATSIGNYESLRFGVTKAEHPANLRASAVFCGTEDSYAAMRGLPIGDADARRVFGPGFMGTAGYDAYRLMDRDYAINESLTNEQIFYSVMARYRMFRRKGFTVRTSTEGDTLMRANEILIVVMARWGGQLERAACAALTTTAPE